MADDPLWRALVDAGVVCRCCLNSRASDYKGEPLKAVPCPVCAPKATPAPHDTLCQRLQQRCSDWGVYWRAADAHGVDLSHAQAVAQTLTERLEADLRGRFPSARIARVVSMSHSTESRPSLNS